MGRTDIDAYQWDGTAHGGLGETPATDNVCLMYSTTAQGRG